MSQRQPTPKQWHDALERTDRGYSIPEAARLSGVPVDTLKRYLEEQEDGRDELE